MPMEGLFHAHPDPALVIRSGRFMAANRAALTLLGLEGKADARPGPSILGCRRWPKDGATLDMSGTGGVKHGYQVSRSRIEWDGQAADLLLLRALPVRIMPETEDLLEEALAAGHFGMWEYDVANDLLNLSPEAARIFGLKHSDFPAPLQRFLDIVHPDDKAAFMAERARAAEGGHLLKTTHRIVRPDGTVRHIRQISRQIETPEGVRRHGVCQDVTEIHSAEAERSQMERLLRLAGQAARLGGWRLERASGRCIWADASYEICGLPKGSAISEPLPLELAPELDRVRIRSAIERSLTTGEPIDETCRIHIPDGDEKWINIVGEAEQDAASRVVALNGALIDVSDRIAVRERNRQLSRRLLETLENISDAFIMLNPDFTFVYLNGEAGRMLQRDRRQLLRRSFWEAFPEADSLLRTQFDEALRSGHMMETEAVIPSLGRALKLRMHPVSEGLALHLQDITESRHTEMALRESEERFRLAASATRDVIYNWNVLTGKHWWSEAVTERFGYAPGVLQDGLAGWGDRVHPEDREAVLADMHAALESNARNWTGEYRFFRADGSIAHVVDRGYIQRDDKGQALRMVGSMSDVTERKELELALHKAAQEAEAARTQLMMAIEALSDAFVVFDAEDRLVYCNSSYHEFYPGIADVLVPGNHFEDIVRTGLERGIYDVPAGGEEAWLAATMQAHRKDNTPLDIPLADGRWLRMIEMSLPDGGRVGVRFNITALKSTERRLADIIEGAQAGTWELDLDTGFQTVNQRWARLLGYTLEEMEPVTLATFERLVHPDDLANLKDAQQLILETGQDSFENELRMRHREGHWIWMLSRGRVVRRAPDGTARVMAGVHLDITERKALESALTGERDFLASLMEASITGVIALDEYGTIVFSNREAESILGLRPGQAVGLMFNDPIWNTTKLDGGPCPVEDLPVAKVLSSGKSVRDSRLGIAMPDGSRRLISVNASPISAPGMVARVVCSVADITATVESEERFRAIAEVASDVIYAYDPVGDTMDFSEGLRRVFGHTWVGKKKTPSPMIEAIHPDDRKRVTESFDVFLNSRESRWHGQYRMRRADGSYAMVESNAVAIRDPEGGLMRVIGSLLDVTEQRETEARLVQAQKLEAVGQLTGGVAHDFNNLLTIILGNAELIGEAAELPSHIRSAANTIERAAERGSDLTSSLLSFARRQPLAPRALDLSRQMQELSTLLQRTLPSNVELVVSCPPDLWAVEADPGKLNAALLNLALNACDAMPKGGQLRIACENAVLEPDRAAPEMPVGEHLRVSVSDTGTGMAQEVLERAFEPFFTTKAPGKGSGVGLSMVYGFARQSGGHATIQSSADAGTTVSIYLRRSTATPADSGAPENDAPLPRGEGEQVLVVEDDRAVRRHVTETLAGLGYRVSSVAHADEALALLQDQRGIKLLFTDLAMPGPMNGHELARSARQLFPQLKILFTSGNAGAGQGAGGDPAENAPLLVKPYRRADLARKLREALDVED